MEKDKKHELSYCKKDRKNFFPDKLRTVADCLRENCLARPDRQAVVFVSGDNTRIAVTFKELYDNAVRFGKRLVHLGVRKDEFVAVSIRTCPEWLYVFFGAMFAGARTVNLSFTFADGSDVIALMEKLQTCSVIALDPGADEEKWTIFQTLISDYRADGHVSSEKLPYLRYFFCHNGPTNKQNILTLSDMMSWENISVELPAISQDDVFTLFQTSGSTGTPKAVVHTHRNFLPAAKSWADSLTMEYDSIYLNDRPFGWAGGFPYTVVTGQTRFTRLEIMPPPTDQASWLIDIIKRERCTHMYALPLSFHQLLEKQNELGSSDWLLEALFTGGQPISKKSAYCIGTLCKRFGNLYGSTEAMLVCCSLVDKVEDYVEYSIGYALEGNEIKIVDENEDIVPVNEKGEIYVKNDAMFKEYCNDTALTRSWFSDDGWLKTDDIGYITEEGLFFCTGRKSDIILSGGMNVTPSILEAILLCFPGVARVVCVPVSHDVMFQVVCACVIPVTGYDVTEEKLRKYCVEMHADKPRLFTVLPQYYLFLEKFPETFSGKVSRKELKKLAEYKFGNKKMNLVIE